MHYVLLDSRLRGNDEVEAFLFTAAPEILCAVCIYEMLNILYS